jgi:hypothetical protein
MAYGDASLSNVFGNSYLAYRFDYSTASPGAELVARFQSEDLFDFDFGNVTLQAATLTGDPAPLPVRLENPVWIDGALVFSFQSAADQAYTVLSSDLPAGGAWQTNLQLTGNGGPTAVTNASGLQRFYRVRSD